MRENGAFPDVNITNFFALLSSWNGDMKFQFREVTGSDLEKFPLWYERIDGPELFSNFIPTTFKTFEDSSVMLWFIIMDDEDEIGTIWFEKKHPEKLEIDFGIYLNRTDLFGMELVEL